MGSRRIRPQCVTVIVLVEPVDEFFETAIDAR